MKQFDTAKIVVTWDCNLNCDYCCNKDPELRATFKPITEIELQSLLHTDFEITGGEPLLPVNLRLTLHVLDSLPMGRNVYLYTNGMYMGNRRSAIAYGMMLKRHGVTGINVGYHGLTLDWRSLWLVNSVVPIRLWVRNTDYDADIEEIIRYFGFTKRIWKCDECYNITTDRFVLATQRGNNELQATKIQRLG